jgi:tRNA(Met) cytidine acetyltransferase
MICIEGELPQELARAIYRGQRRIKGQVLPQLMTQYVSDEHAALERYARVVRIAVLPQWQGHGIGSQLLEYVATECENREIRFIGANFGANPEVMSFWVKSGFLPIRLGVKKETATGEYSVLMLKAIEDEKLSLSLRLNQRFVYRFLNMQADVYHDLDPEVVRACCMINQTDINWRPHEHETRELMDFAYGNRGYEVCQPLVKDLVFTIYESGKSVCLEPAENALLVKKVLQAQQWTAVARHLGYSGKSESVHHLKQVVGNLIRDLAKEDLLFLCEGLPVND